MTATPHEESGFGLDSLRITLVSCNDFSPPDSPQFDLLFWHTNQTFNSCYNYAINARSDDRRQPGDGSMTELTCDSVRTAAEMDGLIVSEDFTTPLEPGMGYYVALAVHPDQNDFHWYRQDSDGCWSHKRGDSEPSRFDESGLMISDPAVCDRGPYEIFCCYMICTT